MSMSDTDPVPRPHDGECHDCQHWTRKDHAQIGQCARLKTITAQGRWCAGGYAKKETENG